MIRITTKTAERKAEGNPGAEGGRVTCHFSLSCSVSRVQINIRGNRHGLKPTRTHSLGGETEEAEEAFVRWKALGVLSEDLAGASSTAWKHWASRGPQERDPVEITMT